MELWDKSSNFCFGTILGFLWSRGQTRWITTCYLSLFQLAYPNTLNSILGVMCEMQLSFSAAGVVSSGICLCVSAAPTWFPPFAPFFYSTVVITPRNRQNSFEGNTNVSDRVVLGYWRWAVFLMARLVAMMGADNNNAPDTASRGPPRQRKTTR